MSVLKEHPLVRSDLREAFDWYEDERDGLGGDLLREVRSILIHLPETARLFTPRFGSIRRVNLQRFPYGVFYVVTDTEIRVLAVLHAARRHRRLLSGRRRSFDG